MIARLFRLGVIIALILALSGCSKANTGQTAQAKEANSDNINVKTENAKTDTVVKTVSTPAPIEFVDFGNDNFTVKVPKGWTKKESDAVVDTRWDFVNPDDASQFVTVIDSGTAGMVVNPATGKIDPLQGVPDNALNRTKVLNNVSATYEYEKDGNLGIGIITAKVWDGNSNGFVRVEVFLPDSQRETAQKIVGSLVLNNKQDVPSKGYIPMSIQSTNKDDVWNTLGTSSIIPINFDRTFSWLLTDKIQIDIQAKKGDELWIYPRLQGNELGVPPGLRFLFRGENLVGFFQTYSKMAGILDIFPPSMVDQLPEPAETYFDNPDSTLGILKWRLQNGDIYLEGYYRRAPNFKDWRFSINTVVYILDGYTDQFVRRTRNKN